MPDGSPTGYEVGERRTTTTRASAPPRPSYRVHLNGVRLPAAALIGDAGRWAALSRSRSSMVGRVGIAMPWRPGSGVPRLWSTRRRYALRAQAVRYGRSRDFGALQAKLAEMAARIACSRCGALWRSSAVSRLEAVRSGDNGARSWAPNSVTAQVARSPSSLRPSETAMLRLRRGDSDLRRLRVHECTIPVERLLRDAKGTEIYEGTNEIMRRSSLPREILRADDRG